VTLFKGLIDNGGLISAPKSPLATLAEISPLSNIQNILILPRWYPNHFDIQSGIFVRSLVKLLSERFQVTVIFVQADANLDRKFEIYSVESSGFAEHIVHFKSASGIFRKLINARRYKKAQWLGYEKLKAKPDLCHVHVPYRPAFIASSLKKKLGIPYVITEHWSGHMSGEYAAKNAIDRMMYRKVLSKASKISTVSQSLRAAFLKNTGFDSVVIPNVIESAHLSHLGTVYETVELLTVADLYDKTKNISGLLRAYRSALDKLLQSGKRFSLEIIGGGPDEDHLHTLAKSLNFESGEVKFSGRKSHEEVLDAYSVCDFYVCNSNIETFGMAVAEALMAGKPVICTRCGGPEEFLSDEQGRLISAGNEGELTSAIVEMSEKFSSYDADSMRDKMRQRFGRETVLSKWVEFYEG